MLNDLLEIDEDEFDMAADEPALASESLLPARLNPDIQYHEGVEKMLLDYTASGAMPHALIFSGPKGIGKATMAFRLARHLLKNGAGDTAQDSLFGDAPPAPSNLYVPPDDPVFHRVASGGHPDLLTIDIPEGKNEINVETARKIAPFLRMTASAGGWRIVIVDNADTMNRNGQNAILKILEEPPKNALLILVTHRMGGLIPTIRSRCRVVPFQTLSLQSVADLLKKANPQASKSELDTLAQMSDGSIGRAMEWMEQGGIEAVQTIANLLSGWPDWDWARLHATAENVGRGTDNASYNGFRDTFLWAAQTLVRAKAINAPLPGPLNLEPIRVMLSHFSLEDWTRIHDTLADHFRQIDQGSLDRRQGVLGAFPLIGK